MDYIVRMITKDAPIVAMAIQGHDLVNRAQEIHHTFPVATAALGRTLLITSMMGEQLKEKDGSVTIRVQGGGPLGTILAVSDSEGNVRGYVQNGQVDLPLKGPAKLDVGQAVGTDGSLTVIKDLRMKEPYVGTVPLVSGEIAEDITSYFAESEQIPTACALGVLVDKDLSVAAAGGYLIQLLPGATDEMIDKIEAGIAKVGPVTEHLRQGVTPEELLQMVLSEFDLELLKTEQNMSDVDDFDFICHVAFDKKPLTRRERAENVKKKDFLNKYSGAARTVLEALLDKYMNTGIYEIEKTEILRLDPFMQMGKPQKIASYFGGKDGYLKAVKELEQAIYDGGAA